MNKFAKLVPKIYNINEYLLETLQIVYMSQEGSISKYFDITKTLTLVPINSPEEVPERWINSYIVC